jgi:hypothetical protein
LPEDRKVMATPPNPMDFGFKVEDCTRETSYRRGVVGHDMLYLRSGMPTSPERDRLVAACEEWDKALQRFDDMRPSRWKNISLREGTILCVGGTDGAVYLKGKFRAMYSQTELITLDGWHKVTGESNVMKLSWK